MSLLETLLRTLKSYQNPGIIHASAVIFLDNRFADFFGQVEHLLKTGFLPSDTIILCRFRLRNFRSVSAAAQKYGVKVRFFASLSSLPLISSGAVIVYPYNGQANARLMLNRGCTHVFVGHGDSNKKASCNPLLRAYDYVLLSGELSRNRLIDHAILRPAMTRDHTICVGTTILDTSQGDQYHYRPATDGGMVGYFPTWEGGFDAENYSSISETSVADLIASVCSKYKSGGVFVDPHPNLGHRHGSYATNLSKLINDLTLKGLRVHLPELEKKPGVLKPLTTLPNSNSLVFTGEKIGLCQALVDVSAAEGNLAMRKIPSAVLLNGKAKVYASAAYRSIKSSSLINITEEAAISAFLNDLEIDGINQSQERFEAGLISYDDPELATLSNRERWNYLRKKYFDSKG